MEHSSKFVQLVEEARKNITECELDFLHNVIVRNQKDFIIIDVREESEFLSGYIERAVHISRGTIEVKIEKMIPNNDQKLLLYCGGGYRSALVAESLQKMGYNEVVSVKGGMRAWKERSYRVVKN
jgi:rhodanese-related sulfurtransferase